MFFSVRQTQFQLINATKWIPPMLSAWVLLYLSANRQPLSLICEICLPLCSLISLYPLCFPAFFPCHHHLSWLFSPSPHPHPPDQDCCRSSRMPTCAASTPKRRWSWTMPDTEPSWHWPSKESRPEPSPLCRSLAPSLPSLPCGLSSCCCGATRPMCHSLLAGWQTHERGRKGWGQTDRHRKERGGVGVEMGRKETKIW